MDQWTERIRPKKNVLDVNLKELWNYRELLFLFVKRDIITQYKQTVLGPLWFIIQPSLTVFMYMIVFGGIAGIPTDGIPQPLFYLAGICLWQYYSDCLNNSSWTLSSNAGLFGKVYFPRLLAPLSFMISRLVHFGFQFGLFITVYLAYDIFGGYSITPNLYALLFPLIIVIIDGMALGFGTFFCSLTTKYRDLHILFSFIVQLWMFITPVVYPLSQLHDKQLFGINLYKVMILNPITPIIETFKYGFLGAGEFIGWQWLLYSVAFMFFILFLGIIMFNKVQRTFMDTV